MPEVTLSGEHHGHAVLVRRRDHLVVANAAAGLHDGLDAGSRRRVEAVPEREEGVAGAHSPPGAPGGALSGLAEHHPNALAAVEPIASGRDYAADVAYARRFDFLVRAGYAGSLVEAALRFALSAPTISTALVGISDRQQLEPAAASAARGPLPADALRQLDAMRAAPL